MGSNRPNLKDAELIQPHGRPLPSDLEPRIKPYYIRRDDAPNLRILLATAARDKPRGTLVFSPGRTEFIEKYLETLTDLTQRGFTVLVIDPRGRGLSDRLVTDPLTSYVRDFQDYADDFAFAISEIEPLLPKPHIAMGHSMGGTIVLQAVLSGVINPSAVICSAPMLGLFDVDSLPMRIFIRSLSSLGMGTKNIPFQRQRHGLPVPFLGNKLTSDKVRYDRWAAYFQTEPRLRVGPPSFGWIHAALKSMSYVNRNADKLNIPALIVAAGADPIVDPASNVDFAKAAGARFHVVPGALHELMMERDEYRDQFFDVLDRFLEDHNF